MNFMQHKVDKERGRKMKIKCDVCDKEEASVFCSADEGALCQACDDVVHLANKLASKHVRFPLLPRSLKDAPPCDVCKERRAFLFCREDRALLCSECDISIHKPNIHTQHHSRFLLTGIELLASKSSSLPTSSSPSGTLTCSAASGESSLTKSNEPFGLQNSMLHASESCWNISYSNSNWENQDQGSSSSSSGIPQHFIETLPGWHFEDFLDPLSSPYAFCKTNEPMPTSTS